MSRLVIDADGQRIGRFESSELEWKPGDVFDLDGRSWRILEILRTKRPERCSQRIGLLGRLGCSSPAGMRVELASD